jgi:sugar O-acyltransferase (sialic acid O-acetyltransferase NeuD family)
MKKDKKLIIVGTSLFAEIAYEYFTHDSEYEVVAFSVEESFLKQDTCFDLPVVAFEKLEELYDPSTYYVFVALTYQQLNRVRTRLYQAAKLKGFQIASYISSKSFVWRNVSVGENCFIFEDNTIQPFVSIGNNVILWSGNHIGHHSKIRDNCFISSHVVICGNCDIGENCFLAVNSVVANDLIVGEDCFINSNAAVMKNTKAREVYNPAASTVASIDSFRLFKVTEERLILGS